MDVDEVLQFVENVADIIPQSQIDCLSVVGREDSGDIVIFFDKAETKNEDLWQALYAHQSLAENSVVSTPFTADSEAGNSNYNVLTGTKRSWSESNDCCEPLDLGLESQSSPMCSPIHTISQREPYSSGTPEKKRKVESILPEKVAEVHEDSLEEDDDGPPVQERPMSFGTQAPKSILKSRPSGKKSSVVFKDTVTLVTHSYVIEGDASRLDQSEEDMNRFEYEGKDRTNVPPENETSMVDAADSDDVSLSRELFASPYQYSSCAVGDVSVTPSSDSPLAPPGDEPLSACDVKKVLFPQEEHMVMTATTSEASCTTSDTSVKPNEEGTHTSAATDSPVLAESSFLASELDTSFLSESDLTDDMLMDALHESQSAASESAGPAKPVTVAAAAPFVPPMSFYSQDLMLDSSPPNGASQENIPIARPPIAVSTAVSTSPALAKTLLPTAAQSPGQTLSIYQSFSQDSPSQPDPIAPSLSDVSSDDNDPLQLKAWPAVLWARTKTFLPAPHLIRTSPTQGTILYLVQKNFRFDDNLALQAAMIASQTLNMPLVVAMMVDQDLLEDLGQAMEHASSMPTTPHSVAAMSTPYLAKGPTTPAAAASLKVEKTASTSRTAAQGALGQKSVARLQAMDGLRLACERHGIPVHTFQYSSAVRYESTAAMAPCPKALAAQSIVAQLFDNSAQQFLSLLFTDDFMHPYTRNMVATLTAANTQLPVFCVESSTMAAPNMSVPLLDADAAVAQATTPKYTSLSEWAIPRGRWEQMVDEQVEQHRHQLDELQQEDALSRLDSLGGRILPPTKGLIDFADELNEWRLVSAQPRDQASPWSLAAQKELQERHRARLSFDSLRSPRSHSTSTLASVAQRCEWSEVVSRLSKETFSVGNLFRSASDRSKDPFQTPGSPVESDASPWPFAASMVRLQLRHLVDSVSVTRESAATAGCSADAIAYFHAAYQLGVLSPIDCRTLATVACPRLPASGVPQKALWQAAQRIVELCRGDDYAQLALYDSRLVQCVTAVHKAPKTPARGGSAPAMPTITASVSWLQTLPLETLTFLFFDKSTTVARGGSFASGCCYLQELRSLWKPFLGPTSAIALPTFETDMDSMDARAATGRSCSRELQWWILSYLLRSPSIAAGVNTAFRHFLLRRTYVPTDEHLTPCVFLLALMELPSRVQNLLAHEPVLGTVHGLQSLLQQRIAQSTPSTVPSLLPFIQEHFLRLDDPR